MNEKISILTVTENDCPALQISLQTVNAAGAVLSLLAINGSLLRLVALPDGESIIGLRKTRDDSILLKIETSHYTLLRQVDIHQPGQYFSNETTE